VPSEAVITVTADGVVTSYDLTPKAIEILDRFTKERGFAGSFGERMIQSTQNSVVELIMRDHQAAAIEAAKPRTRGE
jgi:hypothetical protein